MGVPVKAVPQRRNISIVETGRRQSTIPSNRHITPRSISSLCRGDTSDSDSDAGVPVDRRLISRPTPVSSAGSQRARANTGQSSCYGSQRGRANTGQSSCHESCGNTLQVPNSGRSEIRSKIKGRKTSQTKSSIKKPVRLSSSNYEGELWNPYDVHPAWRDFQDHVRNLELQFGTTENISFNASPKLSGRQRGVLDMRESQMFSAIMGNFSTRFEKKPKLGEQVLSFHKVEQRNKKQSVYANPEIYLLSDDEAEEEETGQVSNVYIKRKVSKAVKVAAKRGWNMIRRHVREMAFAKRANKTTLNWNILRQHFSNISNAQKARMELYSKYIKKPDEWLEGFTTELPESFYKLHQHNIWRRRAHRPRTAIPVIAAKLPHNFEEYIEKKILKKRPQSTRY